MSATLVVHHYWLDPVVAVCAGVGGVRHVLRDHVSGYQVQEMDNLHADILLHIGVPHTANKGNTLLLFYSPDFETDEGTCLFQGWNQDF